MAQIAQAMWLVLSQPALAAELRARGLARAARFTWERTARETIAVYERVLEVNGEGRRGEGWKGGKEGQLGDGHMDALGSFLNALVGACG